MKDVSKVKRVFGYRVVSRGSEDELNEAVNQLIKDSGYEPWGSCQRDTTVINPGGLTGKLGGSEVTTRWWQTLVRYRYVDVDAYQDFHIW